MPEIKPTEYPEWDNFVDSSPQGSVFAKSFWLRGFENLASGNQVRVLATRGEDGRIEAGLPLFLPADGRRRTARAPSLTGYNSLLLAPRSRKDENRESEWMMKVVSPILQEIERLHLDQISLSNSPSLTDIREYSWNGWMAVPRYTYVKNLGAGDFEAGVAKTHGKAFRKAQRAQYVMTVQEGLSREELDEFLKLFEHSYKAIPEYYPRDCHLVRTILAAAAGSANVLFYAAKDSCGVIQSARLAWPSCNGQVMDWAAATTAKGREDGATSFLLIKMFEDLRARGFREFDFCGANIRPIALFKAGFNAVLTPYYVTSRKRASWKGAAQTAFDAMKAVLRSRKT